MQGLTQRGIELTREFESRGIRVIESYPGAAQDILNIPRKRLDESLLRRGLQQFGYRLRGAMTHDELDAVTSALVGQYYLADAYEAIGADDEGFMIIPRSSTLAGPSRGTRVVSMVGLPVLARPPSLEPLPNASAGAVSCWKMRSVAMQLQIMLFMLPWHEANWHRNR